PGAPDSSCMMHRRPAGPAAPDPVPEPGLAYVTLPTRHEVGSAPVPWPSAPTRAHSWSARPARSQPALDSAGAGSDSAPIAGHSARSGDAEPVPAVASQRL